MPEENGIIQRHSELKHGSNSFCDVGNLTHKVVAAHVPENGNADAAEENQWKQERVHRQHQHDAAECNSDGDVNTFLLFYQLFGICDHGRQTGNEALFPCRLANIGNGFHRALCRRSLVEENCKDAILAVFKTFAQIIRQNCRRNRTI